MATSPSLPPSTSTRGAGHRARVLAYMRVSNDLQHDNHTFETQEQRIREKLDARYGSNGYDLTVYKDDGLSGGFGPEASGIQRRTRPQLRRMGEEIKAGHYDCLAVYHSNRLFRSARWFFQYLEDVILPSGIEFISATENLDIASPQGRTMMGLLAVVSASYREDCQQRCRDAHATRAEQGYPLGPPPYGWQFEPRAENGQQGKRGIVRNPATAPHLLYMKERYMAGASCVKIAGELNERGVPSSEGCRWSAGTVIGALKNPIHAGYVVSKRQGLLQGRHHEHRYWERDVHDEIVRLCEERAKRWQTNTGKSGSPHLVNGIACCARCGKRLYPVLGRKYRGYACRNGRNEGQPSCPAVTVRAEAIERVVMQQIQRAAEDPELRQVLLTAVERLADTEDGELKAEQAQLSKATQSVQARMERLLDCLSRGVLSEDDFQLAASGLQNERKEAQEQLSQIETRLSNRQQREAWAKRVQQTVLDFPLCWEHATFDERRHLLFNLIERLTVDRSGRDAIIRVKIHLLPEEEIPVSFESTRHMKDKPTGVAGLTRRELVFLHYVGQGKSHKEIAALMGTGVACAYQFALQVRRALGVRSLQEAHTLARKRIQSQLPFLTLGPTKNCTLRSHEVAQKAPELPESLLQVFPLLARGASSTEVARLTGLTANAVLARRKRILELFQAQTIFEAGERAAALGVLPKPQVLGAAPGSS